MKLSVIRFDDKTNRHYLRLKRGQFSGREFMVEMATCADCMRRQRGETGIVRPPLPESDGTIPALAGAGRNTRNAAPEKNKPVSVGRSI